MEPARIVAGDTASWTARLGDYPASAGWVVTYFLSKIGAAAAPIEITSTASGDDHLVEVPATETAAWTPGIYRWTGVATLGAERHSFGPGTLAVVPDPSQAHDARTHAEKSLASIEAALESAVGTATVECELDGVRVRKDRKELLELREYYRLEVNRERGKSPITRWPVRLRR